jgi:transcriptional regulator GlxA family with amidase domain
MLKSVAVIVVPNFSIFEFGTACEVFGIDRSGRGAGVPAFDFRVCTPEPGNVPMKSGLSMNVSHGLEATEDADLVIMAPFGRDQEMPEPVLAALRGADARGAWVMSICSGAFALARAGLLDGRRCTTHWHFSRDLAEAYPDVQVDENVLYVQDGNIMSSAGTAAGIDACLHLVRLELGANVAASIARDMVVPPHRDGGQAQYVEQPVPFRADGSLAPTRAWALARLREPLTVADLAAHAHVSERTFARRFASETGMPVLRWLHTERIAAARTALETTDASIDDIAHSCGFGTAANLRKHFRRHVSTTPTAYRRAFSRT